MTDLELGTILGVGYGLPTLRNAASMTTAVVARLAMLVHPGLGRLRGRLI